MSFGGPSIPNPKNPYMGRVASFAADQGGSADSALSGASLPASGGRYNASTLTPIVSSAKTAAPVNKATTLGGTR